MSFSTHARLVNPRLGTYFSIFAALFAAIFLMALISEALSFQDHWLRFALFLGPLILYAVIGISVATREPLEFFAAGRRVPAGYTGLLLAFTASGATFLVCGTGVFFFSGFDALVLMIGGLTGFVVMASTLAPFYRKFGAYTVPSYLGRRFDSKALRIVAAMVVAVPMLLVLAAELRLGAASASRLTGLDRGVATLVLVSVLALILVPGGKRSFTWAGVAQAVAALLALAVCVATVSTIVTSLPVPQLTHGPLVRGLVWHEANNGLQTVSTWPLAFGLPGEGMHHLTKPYTAPFGAVGPIAFALGAIMIAAGIASAPWLLPRAAATPGVYEARKSLGWATVLFGITMLTVSSAAVFMRDYVLDVVMNQRVEELPQWVASIVSFGFATVEKGGGEFGYQSLSFDRDAVLFALPLAAGLPKAYAYLAMAGAIAAALVAAGATTVSLAAVLGEDVVQGLTWDPATPQSRIWIVRGFIVATALAGSFLVSLAPTDPLLLVLWALGLTGASLFPVLALSIWWKRLTRGGAMFGIISGFTIASVAIFAGEAGAISLPSALAGILGLPVSAAVAMIVSSFFPETSRHDLEIVRDIRVPGGEIIYDREMRRLQIKKQTRS